ncbi:MAG: hypothetical protein ACYSTT_09240 [Planctomycetota bacterium]|jgi:hypothetical protein
MTIEGIISRLSEFFSGLYYRQWERWELMAIAIAAAVILILIVRAHLKVAANERRSRERSPIVGVRMAQHGRRH